MKFLFGGTFVMCVPTGFLVGGIIMDRVWGKAINRLTYMFLYQKSVPDQKNLSEYRMKNIILYSVTLAKKCPNLVCRGVRR